MVAFPDIIEDWPKVLSACCDSAAVEVFRTLYNSIVFQHVGDFKVDSVSVDMAKQIRQTTPFLNVIDQLATGRFASCQEAVLCAVEQHGSTWADGCLQDHSLPLSFRLRLASVHGVTHGPLILEAETALLKGQVLVPEAIQYLDAKKPGENDGIDKGIY